MVINEGSHGEKLYKITLGTGTAWTKCFSVYAYNEQYAVDAVADYVEEQEIGYVYADHYELADLCDVGQNVDEYAESNNLTCCGNHGIYLEVLGIDIINQEEECKMKAGTLIAVNGKLYEYLRAELGLHRVSEIEFDEDGLLTPTYTHRYFTDEELANNEVNFTQQQWYGIVECFIRQDYDDLTEMQISGAVMDIVDRCFAYGIPKIHELADYIAEYMDR